MGHLTGMLRATGTDLNVHLLSRPFLRREAIASSRIEGAWVRFFLDAIAESAHAASSRAQALVSLRRDYGARLASA